MAAPHPVKDTDDRKEERGLSLEPRMNYEKLFQTFIVLHSGHLLSGRDAESAVRVCGGHDKGCF